VPGLPKTMRAAYVDELGPAENIRYGVLPVPAPGPTDVLVAVEVVVDPVELRKLSPAANERVVGDQ
jgi:hypothetical protein